MTERDVDVLIWEKILEKSLEIQGNKFCFTVICNLYVGTALS